MKKTSAAIGMLIVLVLSLAGCGGSSAQFEDCGTAKLKDISLVFGPTPQPMDFSGDKEMICFEKHIKDCSPAKVSTVSFDGGTTGWFEIKGMQEGKCVVDAYSQTGTSPPIHAECPYDLEKMNAMVSQYEVYRQPGGTAFAFVITAAFTLVKPSQECTIFS